MPLINKKKAPHTAPYYINLHKYLSKSNYLLASVPAIEQIKRNHNHNNRKGNGVFKLIYCKGIDCCVKINFRIPSGKGYNLNRTVIIKKITVMLFRCQVKSKLLP